MKHYTNKKTNEVWGYESLEEAKELNPDFENLVEMDEKTFIHFRDEKPKGGVWTAKGWVIDEELLAQEEAEEKQRKIQSLHDDLDNIERQITRLERIKKRTELEEQELDELIDESTELFRRIESLKTLIKDEEKEE